jgi:hypothetical protein
MGVLSWRNLYDASRRVPDYQEVTQLRKNMKTAKEFLREAYGNLIQVDEPHLVKTMERYSEERLKEWKEKLKKEINELSFSAEWSELSAYGNVLKLIDSL